MSWPETLTTLLKRISTPAEEVFKGLRVLGDYNKTSMDAGHAAMEARLLEEWAGRFATNRFYVDVTNGDDVANDGLTLAKPFATIGEAVDRCKAGGHAYDPNKLDYIFIAPGLYPEGDIIQEGHGTHLIGLGLRGADSGVRIIPNADPTHCILALQAAHVEVANIYFYSAYADPCILSPNHLDNSWIHDCTLAGKYDTTLDCLKLLNTRDSVIEENLFTGFKEKAINCYMGADAYLINTTIRKNRMGPAWQGLTAGAKGVFIEAGVMVYNSEIDGNHINLEEAVGCKGIDCDATTKQGGLMITDNYVFTQGAGSKPIETELGSVTPWPHGMMNNHVRDSGTIRDPYPKATG